MFKLFLLALLILVGLYLLYIRSKEHEGFATKDAVIASCPPNYRFFNDARGESLCCAGKVDPQTHLCLGKGPTDVCAFVPGIKDQRNPQNGPLPVCKDIMRVMQDQAQKEFCPRSLPHHAHSGRCCATPIDPITGNCMQSDLQQQSGYCLTTADRKATDQGKDIQGDNVLDPGIGWRPAEQLCSNIRNLENLQCPGSMVSLSYPMPEYTRNGIRESFGVTCRDRGIGASCEPAYMLEVAKTRQPDLKNLNVDRSIFNCDVYKRVKIDKDLTFPADYTDGNGNVIAV